MCARWRATSWPASTSTTRTPHRESAATLVSSSTELPPAGHPASKRLAILSSALPGFGPDSVIAAAASAGLGAVEWALGVGEALRSPSDVEAAGDLRRRCDRAGLRVCGLTVQDGVLDAQTPVAELCDLAHALCAPHVRIKAPPFLPGGLARNQAELARQLDRAAVAASEAGLALLLEPVPGSAAICAGLLHRMLSGHAPASLGIVFDPGSMIIEGHLAPALSIELLAPYIHHVHIKNMGWRRRRDGRWEVIRTRVDAGIVDWGEVFTVLDGVGYRGWFAFDHLPGVASRAGLRREAGRARELTR